MNCTSIYRLRRERKFISSDNREVMACIHYYLGINPRQVMEVTAQKEKRWRCKDGGLRERELRDWTKNIMVSYGSSQNSSKNSDLKNNGV